MPIGGFRTRPGHSSCVYAGRAVPWSRIQPQMRLRRDLMVLIVLCSLTEAASSLYHRRSSGISEIQIVSAKGAYSTSVEVTRSFFGGHSAIVSHWMEGCGNSCSRTRALPPEILAKFLSFADLKHFRPKLGATRICYQDRDYIEINLVDASGTHYYAGDSRSNVASVQAAQALIAYVDADDSHTGR